MKDALARERPRRRSRAGVFGVPTFVVDDDLFWGARRDRHAARLPRRPAALRRPPRCSASRDLPVAAPHVRRDVARKLPMHSAPPRPHGRHLRSGAPRPSAPRRGGGRRSSALERVRWIPSGSPGHRAAPAHRARATASRWCARRSRDDPRFAVDDARGRARRRRRFTIDTLARLRAELGRRLPLVLIIGARLSSTSSPTWRAGASSSTWRISRSAQRPGYAARPRQRSRRAVAARVARSARRDAAALARGAGRRASSRFR